MAKTTINRIILAAFFVFVAISALTGIIKFFGLHGGLSWLLMMLPAKPFNTAHDWSGALAIAIGLILVFLGWRDGKVAASAGQPPRKVLGLKPYLWLLFILAAIAAAMAFLNFRRSPLTSSEVKQLKAAEVTDYQGERLTSAADLPDNSIKGPQQVDIKTYRLAITGLVDSPKQLTYDQVLGFDKYQKVVDLHCVEGWSARLLWEGVLVSDLLGDVGVKPEAKVAIFHAVDGYTSSLPVEYFEDNDILLGYKMNGLPLMPATGFPFQLVAESKWGYKWVKWVDQIELSDDVNYRGTWEQAGYNNNGDYAGPKFEQ